MNEINEIKWLRVQTDRSQSEFGKLMNISRGTIANWENGIRTPPEYVVQLIKYYLLHEGLIKYDKF